MDDLFDCWCTNYFHFKLEYTRNRESEWEGHYIHKCTVVDRCISSCNRRDSVDDFVLNWQTVYQLSRRCRRVRQRSPLATRRSFNFNEQNTVPQYFHKVHIVRGRRRPLTKSLQAFSHSARAVTFFMRLRTVVYGSRDTFHLQFTVESAKVETHVHMRLLKIARVKYNNTKHNTWKSSQHPHSRVSCEGHFSTIHFIFSSVLKT